MGHLKIENINFKKTKDGIVTTLVCTYSQGYDWGDSEPLLGAKFDLIGTVFEVNEIDINIDKTLFILNEENQYHTSFYDNVSIDGNSLDSYIDFEIYER